MRYYFLLSVITSLIIVLIGCSGGVNPVAPGSSKTHARTEINLFSELPIGVSERFPDSSPAGGEGLFGLFNLHIDPANTNAELTSLRGGDLTDVLEIVDITNFLELAPCANCVRIKSVSLTSDRNLSVSIGIKHPFPEGDPTKPITGRNRADLHLFNIEGIVFSNSLGETYSGTGQAVAGFKLVNADGYTDYLDNPMDDIYPTSATIHPYILHFDDYSTGNFDPANPTGFASVVNPPPSGNLVMPMGCDYDYKDYIFDLSGGPIDFLYAVGCTYAVTAAAKSQRFTPEYRVPQDNKKAASEVHVEIVSNNLKEGDVSSNANLSIKVLDINHGVMVGPNLNQMLADSSVAIISVEVPGVLSAPIVVSSPSPTGGNGRDPLNPLNFEITITNSANAPNGTYPGLVKVLDSYLPGQNTSPALNGKDGIYRVEPGTVPTSATFDITEFATYATFVIDVAESAMIQACFTHDPDEVRMEIDPTFNFDGSCSNDPNGYSIVSFEWDFDWDCVQANFSPDQTTSIPTTSYTYTKPGTFKVGLRVTNNAPIPQTSDIFSDDLIVHGWVLPAVKLSGSDIGATMMWFYSDRRIVSTSDGKIHVLVENFTTTWAHNVDYYLCDSHGTVSSETLFTTNEIQDTGLVVTPSDDVYAFYVKLNGDVYYRKKTSSSGFEPEIFVSSLQPGNGIDSAGYAVNSDGDILVLIAESQTCPAPSQIYMAINEGSGFTKTLVSTVERWTACSTGGGSGVLITVDAIADSTGAFHMAWNGKTTPGSSTLTHLWYCKYDGALGSVIEVSPDDYCGGPVLRIDSSDNLWCGYATSMDNRMAVKKYGNSTFEPSFQTVAYSSSRLPGHCSFDIEPSTGNIMHVFDAYYFTPAEYFSSSKLFNKDNSPSQILSALDFRIDDSTSKRNWWPQVASNPDGHWYAIWDDQRNLSLPGAHGDLYFAQYY